MVLITEVELTTANGIRVEEIHVIDEAVRFAQGFVEDTAEVEGQARRVRGKDVVAESLRTVESHRM